MKQLIYTLTVIFFVLLTTEKINAEVQTDNKTLTWSVDGTGGTKRDLSSNDFPSEVDACTGPEIMKTYLSFNKRSGNENDLTFKILLTLSSELIGKGVSVSLSRDNKNTWTKAQFDKYGICEILNFITLEENEKKPIYFKFDYQGSGNITGNITIQSKDTGNESYVSDRIKSRSMTFKSATSHTELTYVKPDDANITLNKKFTLNAKNTCIDNGEEPFLRITSDKNPINYLTVNGFLFKTSAGSYYCDIPIPELEKFFCKSTDPGCNIDLDMKALPEVAADTFQFKYTIVSIADTIVDWGNSLNQTVIIPNQKTTFEEEASLIDTTVTCTGYGAKLSILAPAHKGENAYIKISSTKNPANLFSIEGVTFSESVGKYIAYAPITFDATTGKASVTLNYSADIKARGASTQITYTIINEGKTSQIGSDSQTQKLTFDVISGTKILTKAKEITPEDTISCESYEYSINVSSPCQGGASASVKIAASAISGFQLEQKASSAGDYSLVDFNTSSKIGYATINFSSSDKTGTIYFRLTALPSARGEKPTLVYKIVDPENKDLQWGTDSIKHEATFDGTLGTKILTKSEDITPEDTITCDSYEFDIIVSSSDCQAGNSASMEISASTISGYKLEQKTNAIEMRSTINNGEYTTVNFDKTSLIGYGTINFNSSGVDTLHFRLTALPSARGEKPTLIYKIVDPDDKDLYWSEDTLSQEFVVDVLSQTSVKIENIAALLEKLLSSGNTIDCNGISIPYSIKNQCQANENAYVVLGFDLKNADPSTLSLGDIFDYFNISSKHGSITTDATNKNAKIEFTFDEENGSFNDTIIIKATPNAFKSIKLSLNDLNSYTTDDHLLGTFSTKDIPGVILDPAGLYGPVKKTGFTTGLNPIQKLEDKAVTPFVANFFTTECMVESGGLITMKLQNPADAALFNMIFGDDKVTFDNEGKAIVEFSAGNSLDFNYTIQGFGKEGQTILIPIRFGVSINGIEFTSSDHQLLLENPMSKIKILTDLDDAVICLGGEHTFTIGVEGTNIEYQWYKGNYKIPGANTPSLKITNATRENDYERYYVVVSNPVDTRVSKTVRLWIANPLESMSIVEYPNPAILGQTYTLKLSGYIDITKYTWKYSSDGATFVHEIGSANNEEKVTFKNPAIGKGTITVDLEHPCGPVSVTQDIIVKYPTGIDDVTAKMLQVYPNPTKDLLNISSDTQISDLTITDVSGRIIYKAKPGKADYQITTTGWNKGIYIANITLETGKKIIKKVIKN